MTEIRFNRYRQLSTQLGDQPARSLLDRLQVLALTQPDAVREFETFMDRGLPALRFPVYPNTDRRHDPDRRRVSVIPTLERRRAARRVSDRSDLASRG